MVSTSRCLGNRCPVAGSALNLVGGKQRSRPTQEIISIPWTFALIPATLTSIYEPVEDRPAAFQGRRRHGCLSTTFGSIVRRPVCESTRPSYLPSAHRADRRHHPCRYASIEVT